MRRAQIAVSIRAALFLGAFASSIAWAPKSGKLTLPYFVAPLLMISGIVALWVLLGVQLLIWGRSSAVLRKPAFTAMPWSGALNVFHAFGWASVGSILGMLLRLAVVGDGNISLIVLYAGAIASVLIGVQTFSAVIHKDGA
jgi:hypothetical protein